MRYSDKEIDSQFRETIWERQERQRKARLKKLKEMKIVEGTCPTSERSDE